jgi:hypothetical protein
MGGGLGRAASADDRLGFEKRRDAPREARRIPAVGLDEAQRKLASELRVVRILAESEGAAGERRRCRQREGGRGEVGADPRGLTFDQESERVAQRLGVERAGPSIGASSRLRGRFRRGGYRALARRPPVSPADLEHLSLFGEPPDCKAVTDRLVGDGS